VDEVERLCRKCSLRIGLVHHPIGFYMNDGTGIACKQFVRFCFMVICTGNTMSEPKRAHISTRRISA
jgi:hypothetical protein